MITVCMGSKAYFFELIQVSIGKLERLSGNPSKEDWTYIYNRCERQTLVGICYAGIQRLPRGQWPPQWMVLKWTVAAERMVQRNAEVDECCRRVHENFCKSGFWNCILKGQSNSLNYPCITLADGKTINVGKYRTAGDIDVWVQPGNTCGHPVKKVIEYVLCLTPGQKACWHHIDFPVMRKAEIEVHYRPAYLCSPMRNRRLQQWFRKFVDNGGKVMYGGFLIPGNDFNIIFQLAHMFKHLFEEGIGLRQVLDYHFVLERFYEGNHKDFARKAQETEKLMRRFGLHRFASALMYVLHEVSGLEETKMIAVMDRKEGAFLLEEILRAGNFGQYDDRLSHYSFGTVGRAWEKLHRNFRFVFSYPEEVLCEPFFRVYHWIWRTLRLWRFE